jgi:uncharacterized protein (TIGR03435 family)
MGGVMGSISRHLKLARKSAVGIAAFSAVAAAAIWISVIGVPRVHAQSAAAPQLTFDVASVKLNHGAPNLHFTASPNGSLHVTTITIKDLINVAYDIKDPQLIGAPDWVNTERCDIDAKLDDAAAQEEAKLPPAERTARLHLRLQSLLADRFKLTVSHETKDLPIFALVVAKGGPKFSPASPTPSVAGSHDPQAPPGRMAQGPMPTGQWLLMMNGAPMSQLILGLGGRSETAGHFITDETGLTATYTFTLHWTPTNVSDAPSASSDPADVSLFTALQEQLGLKLESRKGPVPAIVVQHIERPSEN